jgi:hypothetical protein
LLRAAGFEGSTERGATREPDSDFSSLPMLPPALPDCASARLGANAAISNTENPQTLIKSWNLAFIKVLSIGSVGTAPKKVIESYCLDAVQRPVHPSDCLKVPEPLRPNNLPTLVTVMPLELVTALAEPFGLTRPFTPWPMILPLLTTTAFRLLPEQVVPTLLTIHAPSKPPPPPLSSLCRDARRGSAASDLPRRAGFSDSAARGASRDPDSDFSLLPILPPALPDCAYAGSDTNATGSNTESSAIRIERRTVSSISRCFQ